MPTFYNYRTKKEIEKVVKQAQQGNPAFVRPSIPQPPAADTGTKKKASGPSAADQKKYQQWKNALPENTKARAREQVAIRKSDEADRRRSEAGGAERRTSNQGQVQRTRTANPAMRAADNGTERRTTNRNQSRTETRERIAAEFNPNKTKGRYVSGEEYRAKKTEQDKARAQQETYKERKTREDKLKLAAKSAGKSAGRR